VTTTEQVLLEYLVVVVAVLLLLLLHAWDAQEFKSIVACLTGCPGIQLSTLRVLYMVFQPYRLPRNFYYGSIMYALAQIGLDEAYPRIVVCL
jgi:hypothetical protein